MAKELNIGGILASLRLDNASVKKSVDEAVDAIRGYQKQAERANTDVAKNFERMQRSVSNSIGILTRGLGLLGAAFGGMSIISFSRETLQAAADIENMSKALGITTDQVQELSFAFKQYNASVEQTNAANTKLAANLSELNAGGGGFRQFLRDSAPMLESHFHGVTNVADGYGALADAIAKLKRPQDQLLLAQKALGEDVGRVLLPALKRGSQAFAELRQQAHSSGQVIEESGIRTAAELDRQFKLLSDTITHKLKAAIISVAEAVGMLGREMKTEEQIVKELEAAHTRLALVRATGVGNIEAQEKYIAKLKEELRLLQEAQNIRFGGMASMASKVPEIQPQGSVTLAFEDPKAAAAREAMIQTQLDYLQQLVATGEELEKSFRTPIEQAQAELEELNILLQRGAIDADLFGKAAARSAYTMQAAYASAASAVGRSVAAAFQDNKAVAVASAIIDTYAAANKALASPPGPPVSYAYVAAALATGFANVKSILSTNKGSTSVGGGGGGATAAPAAAPAAAAPGAGQTLFVQGISHSQLYSGAAVDELISAIIARQRDGVKVVLAET